MGVKFAGEAGAKVVGFGFWLSNTGWESMPLSLACDIVSLYNLSLLIFMPEVTSVSIGGWTKFMTDGDCSKELPTIFPNRTWLTYRHSFLILIDLRLTPD